MPDYLCRELGTIPTGHVCVNFRTKNPRDQIRRLLPGSKYTTICDWGNGWDCIGIKHNVAGFDTQIREDAAGRSCPPGALCGFPSNHSVGDSTGNQEPNFAEYEAPYNSSWYDDGFHMMYVDAWVAGQLIRLINGHPQSGGTGSGDSEDARKQQIAEALGTWAADQLRVLVAGDLNMEAEESGEVIAIVDESNLGGDGIPIERKGQGATYNAILDGRQTRNVVFPQFANKAGGVFSSGIQVANATGNDGACHISYDADLDANEFDVFLPANGSLRRYALDVPNLNSGYNASVTVTRTQPVVGIVNLAADPGSGKLGDSFTQANGLNR